MRGLILGFDGVLVHEQPVHAELLRQILADEGVNVSERRLLGFLRDGEGGQSQDRETIQTLLDEHQISDGGLATRLAVRKAAFYQMRLRKEGHRLVTDAAELVNRAHGGRWRLALLTQTPTAEVEGALAQLGVRDFFKTLTTGEAATASAYQEIWRGLNSLPPLPSRLLHPHEVVVLDSSPMALRAAREAGMAPYAITTRHPASAFEDADRVIENLGELLADL